MNSEEEPSKLTFIMLINDTLLIDREQYKRRVMKQPNSLLNTMFYSMIVIAFSSGKTQLRLDEILLYLLTYSKTVHRSKTYTMKSKNFKGKQGICRQPFPF